MLTLKRPDEAAKLSGLKWVCCECPTVNQPSKVECGGCGKQRWEQLGFPMALAVATAQVIADEGHGL